MYAFFRKHKETLIVLFVGVVIMAALNVMMLFYHYDAWTNPKVGFWSAFYKRFEVSGFDPLTYITISQWRPLYILGRHPLLAAMMWPLSWLNGWLKEVSGMNCAIFIVAAVWTMLAMASWWLMYRILRKLMQMSAPIALLLTLWFFSFAHIMLVVFTPDHMSLTLPLLLLAVYLAGKAHALGRVMPLWQSLMLMLVSTGVTTTNVVKIAIADFFSMWKRQSWLYIIRHFAVYLAPAIVIIGLAVWQDRTTYADEVRTNNRNMARKAAKDSTFAVKWKQQQQQVIAVHKQQIIDLDFVTNTEHRIDRLPSLIENVFGEGFLLHEEHTLKDVGRQRPPLVHYRHWWLYSAEALLVLLFAVGVWCGRCNRLVQMTMAMFLFDMLLHVGLDFANADTYIMTAHWAFAIPIAVACLIRRTRSCRWLNTAVVATVLFLTIFAWGHNLKLVVHHILHI